MRDAAIGLDLSESPSRLVVVDGEGAVLGRADLGPSLAKVSAAAREAIDRALASAGAAAKAVGLALPQAGDAPPAEAASSLARAWPGAGDPQALPAGLASAIAEQWCGAARGQQTVVAFSMGDHVTAGTVLDGRPWRGAGRMAGSVGWLALNPVEREDYRRLGGLEAEVAAAGIVRRLVWRIKSGDRSSVADRVGGDLARLSAADVFEGARAGDGVCISVVRDTAKYVGMAVANLVAIVDPETVVLGGVLAASGDLMLDQIRLECGRRLSPGQFDRVRLVPSTLGPDAAAIGAARAAWSTPA